MLGLVVEGLSFHVGSQCTNFDNYTAALGITAEIFHHARSKGYNLKIVDIGGGFPVPYDSQVPKFEKLAKVINTECEPALSGRRRDHSRAGSVHGGNRRDAGFRDNRQGTARRQGFLPY